MKTSTPHSQPAEHQASLWAARLDGSTLTAADQAELETWLETDPAHRELLSDFCQFSADLEQRLPLLSGIRDEIAEIPTVPKTAQLFPWLRRPVLAGAMLTAAAVLAVILWPGQPQNQFQHLTTPVAQRSETILADGSRVELNAQTSVVVELGKTERRVRLAGGEAFFHVTKDPARPFYVETPAGLIRVTGTQFNVSTTASTSLEVTVLEGTVEVNAGDAGGLHSLQSGDKLTRMPDRVDLTTLTPGQLNDALAWRQGQIVFADTPLREALDRFARYHGRTLTSSEAAAGQRVGGIYSLDDLDGFLTFLDNNERMRLHVIRGLDGSIWVDTTTGR